MKCPMEIKKIYKVGLFQVNVTGILHEKVKLSKRSRFPFTVSILSKATEPTTTISLLLFIPKIKKYYLISHR